MRISPARGEKLRVLALAICVVGCGARTGVPGPPRARVVSADAAVADAPVVDAPVVAFVDAVVVDAGSFDAWMPDAFRECPVATFTGTWVGPGASATITQTGNVLDGVWITNARPPFHGVIEGDAAHCVVTMTFPDDGTFVATSTAGGCEIDWSNGTVWRRSDCP